MSIQWKVEKGAVVALIRLLLYCVINRNIASSDFLSYFTTSQYPLPEEFSSLSAHLPLLPPVSSCMVSAHWDMLFGLIYNASPAPGHHVWQMTYFCADPHRALTWGGWVCVRLCVNRDRDGEGRLCLVSYWRLQCVFCIRRWVDKWCWCEPSCNNNRFLCFALPNWPWGVLRDLWL